MTPSGSVHKQSNRNQRGAVLATALAILASLMIIFLSAMTYCLSRYSQHVKSQNRMVASFLADAGIPRALYQMKDSSLFPVISKQRSPNGGSLEVHSQAWGPYVLVRSSGSFTNQTVISTALLGSSPPEYFNTAITVYDLNFPFVVAGNTTIKGDVITGPLGMTTGRIRGEGIVSENYHNGVLHIRDIVTPLSLDSTVLKQYTLEVEQRRQSAFNLLGGTQVWRTVEKPKKDTDFSYKIENNLIFDNCTYASPTRITSLFVNGRTEITGSSKLTGLIEIVSDGPIIVTDSSVVDMAILKSRDSIIISRNAHFSGIAISPNRIVIRDKASMSYPGTILLASNDKPCDDSCGIWITSHGSLEGLCYLNPGKRHEYSEDFQIFLDTGCTLTGAVVSESKTDIRGTINGSIITERFLYTEPTTTYVNWAKDLHVNRSQLSFNLATPILSLNQIKNPYIIMRQEKSE
jgi:hypothetical protein